MNFLKPEQILVLKKRKKNKTFMSNNWKYQYFETNSKELPTNIFKSLEIEHYLDKTLKDNGFNLIQHQINFCNSEINILLLVCRLKSTFLNKSINKNKIMKKIQKRNNIAFITNESYKTNYLKKLIISKNFRYDSQKDKLDYLSNKMLKSLKLFTKNQQNINLTIKEINSLNSKPTAIKTLETLYKFQRTSFFNEGKEILIPFVTQNSAKLLGNFIATQLRTIRKKHNFFFNFLKESLKSLINKKFSNLEGIKIVIKGRTNNASRSRTKIINLGKISLISTYSKINYSESVSFTTNGTIGVKIWISQKI